MQSWHWQGERRPANVTVPWAALVNHQPHGSWGQFLKLWAGATDLPGLGALCFEDEFCHC